MARDREASRAVQAQRNEYCWDYILIKADPGQQGANRATLSVLRHRPPLARVARHAVLGLATRDCLWKFLIPSPYRVPADEYCASSAALKRDAERGPSHPTK
jgi:hypothetical protein